MKKNRTLLGVALAGMLAGASTSQAASILFDADGTGGVTGAQTITGITFGAGNSLAEDGLVSPIFTQYYHASVANFTLNGSGIATPGLNSAYELTAVVKYQAAGSASGATTSFLATGLDTFVEFWFDATPDANALAGTGYNDGVRILSGRVIDGFGTFTVNTTQPPQNFDQFEVDNYSTVDTLVGSGGFQITALVDAVDNDFFQISAPAYLNLVFAEGSSTIPFRQTNPSALFTGTSGGGAPTVAPSLGTINGLNGTDIQLQTTASASFQVVPTPGIASMGLAAFGLLAGLRRRRN